MSFEVGDKVFVRRKEPRLDDKETYIKIVGRIVDAFNALDETGDCWRYKIKDDLGRFVQFYEDMDEGEITLIEKKDANSSFPVPVGRSDLRSSRSQISS